MAEPNLFDELKEVVAGPCGRVLVTKGCLKSLGEVKSKQRVQFIAFAEAAVNNGFDELPKKKYTCEERLYAGEPANTDVMVVAFKPWQLRIYGGIMNWDNQRCFVGVLAVEKKQDKAYRPDLERAARMLSQYVYAAKNRSK